MIKHRGMGVGGYSQLSPLLPLPGASFGFPEVEGEVRS